MLCHQMPRLVDAEQVDVAAGYIPPEVVPHGQGMRFFDGSVGSVKIAGVRRLVFDRYWIVRPADGRGELELYSDAQFRLRHVDQLEALHSRIV